MNLAPLRDERNESVFALPTNFPQLFFVLIMSVFYIDISLHQRYYILEHMNDCSNEQIKT